MTDEKPTGLHRITSHSYATWQATVHDATPMTLESMAIAIQRMKDFIINQSGKTQPRIVNPTVYREAERAQADGATPLEIEYCLIGYSWDDVKNARDDKIP